MAPERPNMLLILCDQERYDLTAPDGPAVDTPNLDRLASEGMRFDRAYTPISICTSARGSLMSGLYPHSHGMLNNCHEPDAIRRNFPGELPTFGELLDETGYRATYVGKWHLGVDQHPSDFGFEYLAGSEEDNDPEGEGFRAHQRSLGVDPDSIDVDDRVFTDDGDPFPVAGRASMPVEATRTHYLTDQTIEALESHAAGDEPFFHRHDYPGPHHPYVVPEPYASMYDPAEIDPWASYDDPYATKPTVHENYLSYRGVDDFDWERWSEVIAKYYGFVTLIDDQIGRILDAIDRLGLEDTAVFHTADHGDFAGSHRQFNKGPMMYEDTYHIPLIVRWPAVTPAGSDSEGFVRLLDLMPTFLEMAGRSAPEGIHGRSILPLLRGEVPADWPSTLFAEYHGDEYGLYSQRMLRSDRFKYVYNVPDMDELYDLRRDPHELVNLIKHPGYREVRDEHRRQLLGWMERTDDTILRSARRVFGDGGSGGVPSP